MRAHRGIFENRMRLYLIHETCFYNGGLRDEKRCRNGGAHRFGSAGSSVCSLRSSWSTPHLKSDPYTSVYVPSAAGTKSGLRMSSDMAIVVYGGCKGGCKTSLMYSEQAPDDSRLSFSTRLQDTTENKRERRTRASAASATHTLSNKPAEEDHAAAAVTANVYQLRVTFFRERRDLCPAFWRYSPCSYL